MTTFENGAINTPDWHCPTGHRCADRSVGPNQSGVNPKHLALTADPRPLDEFGTPAVLRWHGDDN